MAYNVMRGEPLTLVVTLDLDGDSDWNIEDWRPEAQLRREADNVRVAATWAITSDINVMTMVLVTTDLDGSYVADVDFYDPDIEDPDLARVTWPGADSDRIEVVVKPDVSRVPVTP